MGIKERPKTACSNIQCFGSIRRPGLLQNSRGIRPLGRWRSNI